MSRFCLEKEQEKQREQKYEINKKPEFNYNLKTNRNLYQNQSKPTQSTVKNKTRQRMATQQPQQTIMIRFKSTNTSHEIIELEYNQGKTVLDYKEEIAALVDYDVWNVKFVYKGKVLGDKEKVNVLGLKGATVMMVLNKPKQAKEKASLPSSAQVIPKSNLSTGLGGTSPVGFGNYGLVNHPQYMSAISSAVDPQKMNQMLDDPFYKEMIEQMLDDPQTLKQIMEQNPMTKQLMDQNPMMKMIMSNPAMMKMVFNKQTLKMAQEVQKNGGISPESMQQNPLMNNGLFGNNMMHNMMGGTGANLEQSQQQNGQNPSGNANMFGGFGGNPFNPMMGSGFGGFNQQQHQGFNFPANRNPFQMSGGMFGNPFFMQQSMFNSPNSSQPPQTTQQQQNPPPQTSNNFSPLFQNLQNVMEKANQEVKYSSQLKQLSSMGFGNKEKNIKYLKQVDGDIDRALQKLCLDDDNVEGDEKSN